MIDHSSEEEQRRRYLVGDLTEEEKRAIEEQYFTDDEAFERLLAAEDDVVDEYVRGSLSPDERQRAAQRLASDPRKTAFARALARWTELSRSDSARPRSSHVYISFETMSVSSPTPRANNSVASKIGVRISWKL